MATPPQPPPTFTPLEFPAASKLNRYRDWINALTNVTILTAENSTSSQRTDTTYGPLADTPGPEVVFRAGPDGKVQIFVYAHIRVHTSGNNNAYASYEIEDIDAGQIIVTGSNLRSIRTRSNLTESRQLVWREELVPDRRYACRMVYRAGEAGVTMGCEFRKLMVDRVYEP